MDGLNWELVVYRTVKHRGHELEQAPSSHSRLLQHKVLHHSARPFSRNCACHRDPAMPASRGGTVWAPAWLLPAWTTGSLLFCFPYSRRSGESLSGAKVISKLYSVLWGRQGQEVRWLPDCKEAGWRETGEQELGWQASAGPS